MNKLLLIPIILGSTLLVAGSIIVGVTANKLVKANAEYTQSVHEITDEFESFDIDLETEALKFVITEDGKSTITCDDAEKIHHTVTVEDGVLKIKRIDEREWFQKIFNWNFNNMKVTVSVPQATYSNLKIKASTGAVSVPHGYTFKNVNVDLSTGALEFASDVEENLSAEASTGAIHLSDLSAKKVYAKVSTGALRLQNVNVAEDVITSTSTGATLLDNVRAKSLNASGSTGAITVKNTIIEGHMEIKTSTGNIRIEDSDAATVHVKASTGNIDAIFLSSKIVYASSDTGRVDVPHSSEGGKCEMETSTGHIVVKFKA